MRVAILIHARILLILLLLVLSHEFLNLNVKVTILKMQGLIVEVNRNRILLFKCYAFDAYLHDALIWNI